MKRIFFVVIFFTSLAGAMEGLQVNLKKLTDKFNKLSTELQMIVPTKSIAQEEAVKEANKVVAEAKNLSGDLAVNKIVSSKIIDKLEQFAPNTSAQIINICNMIIEKLVKENDYVWAASWVEYAQSKQKQLEFKAKDLPEFKKAIEKLQTVEAEVKEEVKKLVAIRKAHEEIQNLISVDISIAEPKYDAIVNDLREAAKEYEKTAKKVDLIPYLIIIDIYQRISGAHLEEYEDNPNKQSTAAQHNISAAGSRLEMVQQEIDKHPEVKTLPRFSTIKYLIDIYRTQYNLIVANTPPPKNMPEINFESFKELCRQLSEEFDTFEGYLEDLLALKDPNEETVEPLKNNLEKTFVEIYNLSETFIIQAAWFLKYKKDEFYGWKEEGIPGWKSLVIDKSEKLFGLDRTNLQSAKDIINGVDTSWGTYWENYIVKEAKKINILFQKIKELGDRILIDQLFEESLKEAGVIT